MIRKRKVLPGVAAIVAVLAAGCSSSVASITSKGTLSVTYTPTGFAGGPGDPYNDGDQVVIVGPNSAVVTTGTLHETGYQGLGLSAAEDTFSFTVTVPDNLTRYGIQINGQARAGTSTAQSGRLRPR